MKVACNYIRKNHYYELGFIFGLQPSSQNEDIENHPKTILYFELNFLLWEYYLELHFGGREDGNKWDMRSIYNVFSANK